MNRTITAPFLQEGDSFSIDATDSSSPVAIGGSSTVDSSVIFYNSSATTLCFVSIGSSSVVASASTSLPVPPGAMIQLHVGDVFTHIDVICDTSQTATVYVTPGVGMA